VLAPVVILSRVSVSERGERIALLTEIHAVEPQNYGFHTEPRRTTRKSSGNHWHDKEIQADWLPSAQIRVRAVPLTVEAFKWICVNGASTAGKSGTALNCLGWRAILSPCSLTLARLRMTGEHGSG
jgi:hypothetical protein